ncbi:sarcosine oxidase subunit gamma [Allosaccharopolyspora coralli]|nr:sarcosine oxidase subunit gamma family protein [Allosaccharopolyspora coralli]
MADTYGESPLVARADTLVAAADPGAVRLRELPFRAQVNLRVDPKSPAAERIGTAIGVMLPNQGGEVATNNDLTVLWLGPDEWLVLGPDHDTDRILTLLRDALDDDFGSVTDVSAHRTVIDISGPRTRELLAKGCSLDLHPRVFGAHQCAQTLLGRAQVVLLCWDEQRPHYWLFVRASFARHVVDWLNDACLEYRGGWP